MALKDNLYYWQTSLDNLESVHDDYYVFDEIIVNDKNLISKVNKLRDLIISYCVLLEKNEESALNKIFKEIFSLVMTIDKIQYHEFVAFWKVLDISYSQFCKLPDKAIILKNILVSYCQRRRKLYDQIGYSNVTLQALYDFGASRKKGVAGNKKIIDLIKDKFETAVHATNLSDLDNHPIAYCEPDRKEKALFLRLCKKYNLSYEFGKNHQDKIFDIFLKIHKHFFLIEAKHMKEGGGAQNKQVVEVIDFIGYDEVLPNIHYVTFMDGVYFNRYAGDTKPKTKTGKQKQSILENLEKHKNNFFVNTVGFKSILNDMVVDHTTSGIDRFLTN